MPSWPARPPGSPHPPSPPTSRDATAAWWRTPSTRRPSSRSSRSSPPPGRIPTWSPGPPPCSSAPARCPSSCAEIPGFIVNRLQGALLMEAFRLVEDGYVSGADLDKAVKDGLGLRWSFMGPFETIDLNAPVGLADYCARYGPLYHQIAKEATPRVWSEALIGKVARERLEVLPASERPARQAWRDRLLTALVAHKRAAARKEVKEK